MGGGFQGLPGSSSARIEAAIVSAKEESKNAALEKLAELIDLEAVTS